MWVFYATISAVLLGFYDVCKKQSLNRNAVIPVLFFASLTGAILFVVLLLASRLAPAFKDSILYIPTSGFKAHLFYMLKSVIVGTSWLFAYKALKHLPITIVTPIRSTSPLWTIIGALIIFAESPTTNQWIGMAIILMFFYLFSLAGKSEGIFFLKNKYVGFIVIATFIGAASGLYDKFLLQHHNRLAVQAWATVYMVFFYLPFITFIWWKKRNTQQRFTWRWTIPLIGLLLAMADYAYFYALHHDDALISVISVVRRCSVVFSFTLGGILFKDKKMGFKAILLIGILMGVAYLIFKG